jgi:hypothetical protein
MVRPTPPTKAQAKRMSAGARALIDEYTAQWESEVDRIYPLEMLLLVVLVQLRSQPDITDEQLMETIEGLSMTADAVLLAMLRSVTN